MTDMGVRRSEHLRVVYEPAAAPTLASKPAHVQPRTRADCPTERPCLHLGCPYNTALDVLPDGTLVTYRGRRRVALRPTARRAAVRRFERAVLSRLEPGAVNCALDVAENHPGGLTSDQVADVMGGYKQVIQLFETTAMRTIATRDPELARELAAAVGIDHDPSAPWKRADGRRRSGQPRDRIDVSARTWAALRRHAKAAGLSARAAFEVVVNGWLDAQGAP